jgi:hypothetical protein
MRIEQLATRERQPGSRFGDGTQVTRRAEPQEEAQTRTSLPKPRDGVVVRGEVRAVTVCPNRCTASGLSLPMELCSRGAVKPPVVCPARHRIRVQYRGDSHKRGSRAAPAPQRCLTEPIQQRDASAPINRTSPILEIRRSEHRSSSQPPYQPAKPQDRDDLLSRSYEPHFCHPPKHPEMLFLQLRPVIR